MTEKRERRHTTKTRLFLRRTPEKTKTRNKENIVRVISVLFALALLGVVSGCGSVTEQDLDDLQSPNEILKKEAIQRISKTRRFPLSLVDRFLARDETERAVAIMVEFLRRGKESKDMERVIVKSLGQLSRRTEIPVRPLIELLKDKDPRMRVQVVEALGKSKNKEALTALLKLLGEEKDKYPIIWAIGEIGDKSAIPHLNQLLASEDNYLRFNAYKALVRIGNGRTEDYSTARTGNKPSERKPLGIAQQVLKTYQYMMISLFQRIAGLKRA